MGRRLILATSLLCGLAAELAAASDLTERIRAYRKQHEAAILRELAELVSLPNVATDHDDIRRNADHLLRLLARRGIAGRLLEATDSPPAVFGELEATEAADSPTIVLYAHYDGQPVDPARWSGSPWSATLRTATLEAGGEVVDLDRLTRTPGETSPIDPEWRLYGRSASDDKAPIVALLTALDALEALGVQRSVNLKLFFEGEEEQGSPHLAEMLRRHRDLLEADLWIFCDGPVHASRQQQVVFGVRGVMGVELTTYGPVRPLHSGHYGNWAPNPGALLVHLLAGMRDSEGEILIEGFYDPVRPLTDADREALASVPAIDDELRWELGLAASEADNAPLVERILRPALNVRGITVGSTGAGAKNAIPDSASASVGFRLVPDQTPEDVRDRVERHFEGEGWHLVRDEPDLETRRRHPRLLRVDWGHGYRAMRTPLDHPASRALLAVVDEALGSPAVRLPILGGSLPMYLFEEILGAPLIVLPMVNHDNNQHAPNENLRLQNLWDGIELYASVIARLGAEWG